MCICVSHQSTHRLNHGRFYHYLLTTRGRHWGGALEASASQTLRIKMLCCVKKLLVMTGSKERKNILKMNKEVGMLLPKKS